MDSFDEGVLQLQVGVHSPAWLVCLALLGFNLTLGPLWMNISPVDTRFLL